MVDFVCFQINIDRSGSYLLLLKASNFSDQGRQNVNSGLKLTTVNLRATSDLSEIFLTPKSKQVTTW
jgi:hypothetical protein